MNPQDTPSSANSKVIVQCTDPNDLFDRVEPRVSARNPLRNLHWKAPNRPLRSISNLNISLTREDKSTGTHSLVRRHQIPGLRETPYVKLLLVRCDDKETYKERVRKDVRQWVKTQSPASEGKSSGRSQEDHDASEWLILHVVFPNTPAASQPKSSKHISVEASESTDSVNSKSKWPGKGSSTILDKLRADFSSSKSSINRVAQIRLLELGDKSTSLTLAELEEQWQGLVDSLKSCILRSFDARVAQYESDIRERDSQRHLPGWNFCTFFVLKEGLAKGFENLGLLEDALAVYDELSLGLDSLVTEQALKDETDDSGALLTFSKESKAVLRAALESEQQRARSSNLDFAVDLKHLVSVDRDNFPFDVEKKNYRNLILTNEVSALDLRIYLFTREIEILTRQAQSDLLKSPPSKKLGVDPAILARLVERSVDFISLAGRNLRQELYRAWGGQDGLSDDELHHQRTVASNVVYSWQWRAAMQILGQALESLSWSNDPADDLCLGASELSEDQDMELGSQTYDSGSRHHRLPVGPDMRSPSRERSQERSQRNSMIPNGMTSRRSMLSYPGYRQLALWVSKLALMAKRVLASLEFCRPWIAEMQRSALEVARHDPNNHTPNGDIPAEHERGVPPKDELLVGLDSQTLQAACSSKQNFTSLYVLLSIFAYRTVSGTGNRSMSQQALTDLVEVEYWQGNHTIAARYLRSVLGPLPQFSYRPSEGYLLFVYADCLKNLELPVEYAKCIISCLHHTKQSRSSLGSRTPPAPSQYYIDQLFQTLPTIPPMTLPAASLFHISRVSTTISSFESKDGFSVSVSISCVSGFETPPIQGIKLRMTARDSHEPRSIVLTLRKEVTIISPGTDISLETAVTTHGWYLLDDIELSIGNLRLLHHFKPTLDDTSTQSDEALRSRSPVVPLLVYPSYRNLAIKVYPFPIVRLGEIRRLLLQIRPGDNTVKQCKVRIRTATAGLRLNIHDSKLVKEVSNPSRLATAREGDALLMIVDDLAAKSVTDIEIPYTMELVSEPSISLRVEVIYETEQGIFTLYDTLLVKVLLPVTVNVHDIFRRGCTYFKFTVSPSTMVPLRLIGCRLEENKSFEAVTGGNFHEPFVVFPKQPANWTVRLVPRQPASKDPPQRLALAVDFQSLDGVIFAILETHLIQEIVKTPHAFAARLLAWHLVERVRTTWTEQDVEVAGLLQEFQVWKMEDMQWQSVLCAFDRDVRSSIEVWLRQWHSRTPSIKFSSMKVPQRQLQLFVDVPTKPILISAFLDLQIPASKGATATIGQPIMAEFVAKLDQRVDWEMEGSFELVAPSDSWLIVGRRKGNLRLTDQPTRTPIVLLPQHLGHQLLPTITMRCRKRVESSSDEEWADVISEVCNPTHSRSILVTPDLRSTTVEVFGAVPDDGTGRLVASENRGDSG